MSSIHSSVASTGLLGSFQPLFVTPRTYTDAISFTISHRKEALHLFRQSPFFRAWHPSVVDAYVQHALVPDPVRGGVTLKQTPEQEACVFADSFLSSEIYDQLDRLDEGVELMWIMPGKDGCVPRSSAGFVYLLAMKEY